MLTFNMLNKHVETLICTADNDDLRTLATRRPEELHQGP